MLLVRQTNLHIRFLALHRLKQTLVTLQQQPSLRQESQRHQVAAVVAVVVAAVAEAAVAAVADHLQPRPCRLFHHQRQLCRPIRPQLQPCLQALHEIQIAVL
jgi:hypothetical protein